MRKRATLLIFALPLVVFLIVGAFSGARTKKVAATKTVAQTFAPQHLAATSSRKLSTSQKILFAARAQIGDVYDPNYFVISYPNGDVPTGRGACTDVVIRALRGAGFDLQSLVHADMKQSFSAYPHKWNLHKTDANIDHRRVPNLMIFFKRHGQTSSKEISAQTLNQWQPGDIICWKLPTGLDHIGIVSDRKNPQGTPLAIHNLATCAEADVLGAWTIQGHFRFPTGQR